MRSLIPFVLLITHLQSEAAQTDSLVRRNFWIAYTYGTSAASVDRFQRWAASEGVQGINSISRNRFIGIDMLYHTRKLVYGLSSHFELPDFLRTEPYYASVTFRLGYPVWRNNGIELKGFGGFGVGFGFVRFPGDVPQSLQEAHARYDDPFARASLLTGRIEGMLSYKWPSRKEPANGISLRPVIFINAGVTPTLYHGRWNYGETVVDAIDGNSFVGERVSIPRFYGANWFLCGGVGISFGR